LGNGRRALVEQNKPRQGFKGLLSKQSIRTKKSYKNEFRKELLRSRFPVFIHALEEEELHSTCICPKE